MHKTNLPHSFVTESKEVSNNIGGMATALRSLAEKVPLSKDRTFEQQGKK